MLSWILFSASTEVGCDAVWEKDLNSHICYQFNLLSSLSWTEAHSSCQMQGGALLSIADETEENFIRSKQVDYASDIDTKCCLQLCPCMLEYILEKQSLGKYFSLINMVQTHTQNFDLNPGPFHLAPGHVVLMFSPLEKRSSGHSKGPRRI